MMKISFESEIEMPYIERAFYILTEGCRVHLDDVHYDEAQGIVEIYLQRKEIKEFKRSFWFWGSVRRVYGHGWVKSLLRIKQVEGVDSYVEDSLISELNSTFTVYFGVTISKNEVWIASSEESRGKNLCRIIVRVKKLDIEYVDPVMKM